MSSENKGPIEGDNAEIRAMAAQISLASLLPPGSEPHRLAHELRNLPSLPDRFNTAFLEHGWVYVEFACGHEAAEHALSMHRNGINQLDIDNYLAQSLLGIEPIKWQSLKIIGGGMVDPDHPVRASIVERIFEAYESDDYLVLVPLILMLVDGFGVSLTGTKSMFSDLESLDDLFQSSDSVAGHPSALKGLLVHLRKSQRGYSEQLLTMPLRNGILHGTRLNYANQITATKAINLLAAVVEWARDIAPEPKNDSAKREWNFKFLSGNLVRLNPNSPQYAFELFQSALSLRRYTDVVALINYHPVLTLLSEKIKEWRELDSVEVTIEPLTSWEIFGDNKSTEQHARCNARLLLKLRDNRTLEDNHTLRATRSIELARAELPSIWQIDLGILGAIRRLIDKDS